LYFCTLFKELRINGLILSGYYLKWISVSLVITASCISEQGKKGNADSKALKSKQEEQIAAKQKPETTKELSGTKKEYPGMVYFPGGEIKIGAYNGRENEQPVFTAKVQPFWLDKYLVTVKDFRKFINPTGYKTDADKFGNSLVFSFKTGKWEFIDGANWQYPQGRDKKPAKDDYPVTQVSYHDAMAYAKWAGKRLPTETEWEYAALGLIGNTMYERVVERRLYPWNGHITRTDDKHNYGDMVANFKRGRGDYMGVAGNLNDAAAYTAPVYAYWPNDYGLYNMAGNVSEWVMDVYRPLSFEDVNDMSAFRGNVYKTYVRDNDGAVEAKLDYILFDYEGLQEWLVGSEENPNSFRKNLGQDINPYEAQLIDKLEVHIKKAIDLNNKRKFDEASDEIILAMDEISGAPDEVEIANELYKGFSDFIIVQPGDLRQREVTVEENLERRNYRKANNVNYLDGDYSTTYDDTKWDAWKENDGSKEMYDYSNTSMINDKARVYKGGSWKDGAYWLSPGTRRYLDERQSTSTIGFRCAMTRVGSPIGNY